MTGWLVDRRHALVKTGPITSGWSQTCKTRLSRRSWSPRPDSNRGPFPYQGNALPPELRGRAAAQRVLKPGNQLSRFREDLSAAPNLDRRGQLGELRHQDLACVQALRMVRSRVFAAGQVHDVDGSLERLDHDVAAGSTLFVVGHRLPRPLPLPLDCALGRTVSSLVAACPTSSSISAASAGPAST